MIYFGIDGGSTNVHIKIYEDNKMLSETFGKPTNVYIVGEDKALEHLDTLFKKALDKCNLTYKDIDKGCIGIPASSSERVKKIYRSFFKKRMPKAKVLIVSEAEIALKAVTGDLHGIVLINGTGSLALSRNKDGEVKKVGGYGYILGDEGSAYWMAKEAIKRVIRISDGRGSLESTVLTDQLLSYFKLNNVREFLQLFHDHFSQTKIASSAPLITQAAIDGDRLAIEIVEHCLLCCLELVDCLIEKDKSLADSTLVLYGGVLNNDKIIGPKIKERLKDSYPNLVIKEAGKKTVDGAIKLVLSTI